MIILDRDSDLKSVDYPAGACFLIDKEKEWTSFDVVNKLRFSLKHGLGLKKFKVGHAGTLDPLATGLLLVCVGKYTKLIGRFQGMEKEYYGIIKLGSKTDSYDRETEEKETIDVAHLTAEKILKFKDIFLGEIEQKPPVFSAIKKNGVPLYKLARAGKAVEIKKRKVKILKYDIEEINLPFLTFRINCSKGTYIRSLANDLGEALAVGAYLYELRRDKIGIYSVDKAFKIGELVDKVNQVFAL